MSQLSKVRQSRTPWKHKATQRANQNRYQRKQLAQVKHERDRTATALKAAQARLRQFESQSQGLVARPKVDVVFLALQLFLMVRIGFRPVSRVLKLLAWALGIKKAPCPQTIIHWVMRLSIVRIEAARTLKGVPLRQTPFTNGLISDIEQPLTRRNLINLAHILPKQSKDFDLHLVETFNEVMHLTLYAHPDPMNPFKQLENPT